MFPHLIKSESLGVGLRQGQFVNVLRGQVDVLVCGKAHPNGLHHLQATVPASLRTINT